MKEFILTITHNGRRAVYRQWAHNAAQAKNYLKADIGSFSVVKCVQA